MKSPQEFLKLLFIPILFLPGVSSSQDLNCDVVINSDGSLKEINLRRSSGHQILDDAAKRIVQMSSPFEAFPANLQKQADIIHITRSWEFQSNHQLRSY